MPFLPEAELKRPDLKGKFICGQCGRVFCHNTSLNRHRTNAHSNGQHCLLCNKMIPSRETIKRHMHMAHDIKEVITCGCCNWTFRGKRDLHTHNAMMKATGQPGEELAIARCEIKPGSLAQHEILGVERPPRKAYGSKQPIPLESQFNQISEDVMTMFTRLVNAATSSGMAPNRPSAPAIKTDAVAVQEDKENVDVGKIDLSKIFGAPIVLKTQAEKTPSPSSISPNSEVVVNVEQGQKRRSIDDLCFNLAMKKSCP